MTLAIVTMKRSGITYEILLIILAICLGCAATTVSPGYIVKPHYTSAIRKNQITAKGLGSIRINTMEFDEPCVKNNWENLIKVFTPILCLIPGPETTWKNTVLLNTKNPVFTTLQNGDIENILVSEIKNSGMFDGVEYKGLPRDYDIKDRVNLTIEDYIHNSGLGILYGLSIIGTAALPMYTSYYTGEVHFDVISTKDKKWEGTFFYDINVSNPRTRADARVFGDSIFPMIMKEFIDDLQHNLKPQSSIIPQLE